MTDKVVKTGLTVSDASPSLKLSKEQPKKGLLGHIGVGIANVSRYGVQVATGVGMWLWGQANAQTQGVSDAPASREQTALTFGMIGAVAVVSVGILGACVVGEYCRRRCRASIGLELEAPIINDSVSVISIYDHLEVGRFNTLRDDDSEVHSVHLDDSASGDYDIGAKRVILPTGEVEQVDLVKIEELEARMHDLGERMKQTIVEIENRPPILQPAFEEMRDRLSLHTSSDDSYGEYEPMREALAVENDYSGHEYSVVSEDPIYEEISQYISRGVQTGDESNPAQWVHEYMLDAQVSAHGHHVTRHREHSLQVGTQTPKVDLGLTSARLGQYAELCVDVDDRLGLIEHAF